MPDDVSNMFQVFDALFDADQWHAAVEYAHDLANEYRRPEHIYRAVNSGQPVLLAIVLPVPAALLN